MPFVCFSSYETQLYTAVFCAAFFGFFRVSELVQSKPGQEGIALRDVTIQKDKLVTFTLRHSKGDRAQLGVSIKLSAIPQHPLCPVRAMENYLGVRPQGAASAFVHFDHSNLTRFQFQAVLKKALDHSGHDASNYSSHSFRIGAATTAAANGISQEVIQSLGRWGSNAFHSYIRLPQILT